MTEHEFTRRAVTVGGATVIAPTWVDVVVADTASGEVELDTESIVRFNTTLDATVYEDLDGTGEADNTETVSLNGGTETNSLATLDGSVNEGIIYWIEFNFATSDNGSTAELDSATIKLPDPDDSGVDTREPEVFRFDSVSTGRAIFMTAMISMMGAASFALKNWAGVVFTGLAVVAVIMAGVFGIGIELFWALIALAALTIVVGAVARVAQ